MIERDADDMLIRRAAVRLGWQLAAVAAGLVILAVLGALVIEAVVHGLHPPPPRRPDGHDSDDQVLRIALLAAGGLAVVISGFAGFLLSRRAVRPLGDALALQRRFVADAGHELRTPLTVLHTRAQIVARKMRADDPARPDVEQLLADSRVLGDIVEELLESAQLAAGQRSAEPIDVDELVAEVVTTMAPIAANAAVGLVADPPAGLTVTGSWIALRRALTSLVDNALGHTPSQGTVRVGSARVDGACEITVTDDGEGPNADAVRLTERFARGTNRATGPAGRRFGLGLALVREITEVHGGTFELRRHETHGAVATLRIPMPSTGGSAVVPVSGSVGARQAAADRKPPVRP